LRIKKKEGVLRVISPPVATRLQESCSSSGVG